MIYFLPILYLSNPADVIRLMFIVMEIDLKVETLIIVLWWLAGMRVIYFIQVS